MFATRIRKVEDGYEVVIPDEEIELLGLSDGAQVEVRVTALIDSLSPELQAIVDEIEDDSRPVMISLRDR